MTNKEKPEEKIERLEAELSALTRDLQARDTIIEELRRDKNVGYERGTMLKKENTRIKAEVESLRKYIDQLKGTAYRAVAAEAESRNVAIDKIYERLKTTIAISEQDQHAVMEIIASAKVQKIGASPSSA